MGCNIMNSTSRSRAKNYPVVSKIQAAKNFLAQYRSDFNLLLAATVAVSLTSFHYLWTMFQYTGPGFTIDDSWIHFVYAQRIFQGIPWQYSPGYPSTGSTSPLWSVILSLPFFLSQETNTIILMVYLISIIFYIACTFLVGKLIQYVTEASIWGYVGVLGFILIPRNTWLMLSGMETPLFVFMLLLGCFVLNSENHKTDFVIGVIIGLAFLSRPEGGIILGFATGVRFLYLLISRNIDIERLVAHAIIPMVTLIVASPWIIHCLHVTGLPLPDTFYVKAHVPQAYEIEAWNFWWNLLSISMPFLLFGTFSGIILFFKKQPYPWILAVMLTLLYRLSSPYAALINNLRYLVPVFLLIFVSAIAAVGIIIQQVQRKLKKPDINLNLEVIAIIITVFMLIIPLISGYSSQSIYYAKAVRTVNEQHVVIGKWLNENTSQDAVFASHDAGALVYYANRTFIDIVGLVSPEIAHGNMTTQELLQYLKDRNCSYIVSFPGLISVWARHLSGAYVVELSVYVEDHVGGGRPMMNVYRILWNQVDLP